MTAAVTATRIVLAEVDQERRAQDAKWGEQNRPDGTGGPDRVDAAGWCRRWADMQAAEHTLTWTDVLEEETAEALAETDPSRLRAELVQVAAVAVAWVEAIDRRAGGRPRILRDFGDEPSEDRP